MVSRGAYFISVEDPSYIGDYITNSLRWGPLLYNNYDEYMELVKTPMVAEQSRLEEQGIKVLSELYLWFSQSHYR